MPAISAGDFLDAVGCLLKGCGDQCIAVDAQARKGVVDSQRLQVSLFGKHGEWMQHHEARKMRPRAGDEGPAAELGEGVVPAIGRDDVVRSLRSAVVADDCVSAGLAGQVIDDAPLAGVSVTQVGDQDGLTSR